MSKARQTHPIVAAISSTAFLLALAITPPAAMAQASTAAPAEQSSTEGGVTVKVTPKSMDVPVGA